MRLTFRQILPTGMRKIHGAMKPPELMAELVAFFSKAGETILDPFAGVGGTLLGAELVGRKAIGIELNPTWVNIYHKLIRDFKIENGRLVARDDTNDDEAKIKARMISGDCLVELSSFNDDSMAAIITDPPYGCNHGTKGFKDETNFNMNNHDDQRDLGNSENFDTYLKKMQLFGGEAYRILQPGRYLVLLIGDRFYQGEYIPGIYSP